MAAAAATITVLYVESRPVNPRTGDQTRRSGREYLSYYVPALPRAEIRAALAETERPLSVRVLLNASPRRLSTALGGVDIVHLALHARRDQRFSMTDSQGFLTYVSAGRLARLLLPADPADRPPLVILATPFSDKLAPALRAAGIPAIIAVEHDYAMPASVARAFYTALYTGLADAMAPIEAFQQARRVIVQHPLFGDRSRPLAPDGSPLPPFSQRFRLFLSEEPAPLRATPLSRGAIAWEEPPLLATVPFPPSTFPIRRRLLAEATSALVQDNTPQVVNLAGDGGMGKTSLAAEVARWLDLHGYFPGGIVWFRCAEIQPPLARIFAPRLTELVENWPMQGDGRRLLVLDGLEVLQPFMQDGEQLHEMISAVLGHFDLSLLVTARESLGLGETEQVISVGPLSANAARTLFAERAGALASTRWDGASWESLERICDLLGYQALAISVAGAFAGHLDIPLTELYERLQDLLGNIEDSEISLDPMAPLRALLGLLLGRLDDVTRNLFHLLGAFPAGAPPQALDTLVGSDRWRPMAENLKMLGLVSEEGGGRYFQSDVLRAVSSEGLAAGDWWHLSAWYLQRSLEMHGLLAPAERETLALRLFNQMAPQLTAVEEINLRRGLDFFDRELPNILAVVQFAAQLRAWTRVADLVERLHLYLRLRGLTAEQAWAAEQAVIAAERSGDSERLAMALLNQGEVALVQGRFASAERAFQESLVMFQGRQDPLPAANVLHNLGIVYLNQERLTEAEAAFQQGISLFEEGNDHFHLAATYHNLGNVYKDARRWADAERALRQSLVSSEAIGDQLGLAETLSVLGLVLDYEQQWEEARLVTERALEIVRTARVPLLEAAILWNWGGRLVERGDIVAGLQGMAACIAIERDLEHPDVNGDMEMLRSLMEEHKVDAAQIDSSLLNDVHHSPFYQG